MKNYDKKLLNALRKEAEINVIESLLKQKANPNYRSDSYPFKNCFEEAIENGNMDVLKLLAIHGVNVESNDNLDKILNSQTIHARPFTGEIQEVLNITNLISTIQKIDNHLKNGEFNQLFIYDLDVVAGRYVAYLSKKDGIKNDSEESSEILAKIFPDLQGEQPLTEIQVENIINILESNQIELADNERADLLNQYIKLSISKSDKINIAKAYIEYKANNEYNESSDIEIVGDNVEDSSDLI